MSRGLLFRRIFVGCLVLVSIVATALNIANETKDVLRFLIGLLPGLMVLVEPASIIWDRYGGGLSVHRRKPSADAVRDVNAYLEGRLRQFDDESKLFVELAGDTIIETTFSSEAHQFEDIQKAVELHKGRFVLIGEPGAGKSTTMRQLMIRAIRDYHLKTNPRLPVEINLGLSETPTKTDELLEYWWDKWYLPSVPDEHITNDRVWFFMDGLNEMPLDSREERAQALKAFLDKHPTLPVIVTCRVRDYEDDEKLNLGLPMVRVHELDEGRIQEFITKRGASADLWDKIRSNEALRRMADNPYKLVMLIAVYQARRELPERLDELYGLYVTEAYRTYKDEREKLANTSLLRLTWPKLETQLKRLAFLMIKDGKGTAASVDWARRKIGKRALMDGVNLGVLLVDGEDVKFYHQSLHGYFAVEKLGQVLDPKGKSERQIMRIGALIRQIEDLGEAGAIAVDALKSALISGDEYIHRVAVEALCAISTYEALMTVLIFSQDQWRRIEAISGLAELRDIRAVEILIRLLDELDESVRSAAADALGQIGDSRAVDPLIKALNDSDPSVRWNAADALRQIADPRAVDPLIKALNDSEPRVREWAAVALGYIADPRVVDSLTNALYDSDPGVRLSAASALGQIANPRNSDFDVQEWALTALREISTPEAFAAVEQWLHDRESRITSLQREVDFQNEELKKRIAIHKMKTRGKSRWLHI